MPLHTADRANNRDFVEFWIDPTASPPYALLLLGKGEGPCRIVDPSEDYVTVYSGNSYDEARLWLLEDEYERVEGRWHSENGKLEVADAVPSGREQ